MTSETSASVVSIIVLLIIAIATFTGHDFVAVAMIVAITLGFAVWALADGKRERRATENARKHQHNVIRDKCLREMAVLNEEK